MMTRPTVLGPADCSVPARCFLTVSGGARTGQRSLSSVIEQQSWGRLCCAVRPVRAVRETVISPGEAMAPLPLISSDQT